MNNYEKTADLFTILYPEYKPNIITRAEAQATACDFLATDKDSNKQTAQHIADVLRNNTDNARFLFTAHGNLYPINGLLDITLYLNLTNEQRLDLILIYNTLIAE